MRRCQSWHQKFCHSVRGRTCQGHLVNNILQRSGPTHEHNTNPERVKVRVHHTVRSLTICILYHKEPTFPLHSLKQISLLKTGSVQQVEELKINTGNQAYYFKMLPLLYTFGLSQQLVRMAAGNKDQRPSPCLPPYVTHKSCMLLSPKNHNNQGSG